MELGIPVIMAINMMDLVEKNGDKIHIDKLSRKLGCEVVEISALKGTGIQKAAEKAVALAQQKKNMVPVHEFSKDAEDVITEVENKLSGIVSEDQKRFFAIKLLEKDDKIKEQMNLFRMYHMRSRKWKISLMMILRVLLQTSVMYTFHPSLANVFQRAAKRNLQLPIRSTVS